MISRSAATAPLGQVLCGAGDTAMGPSRRIEKPCVLYVFWPRPSTPVQIDKTGAIFQDTFWAFGVPSARGSVLNIVDEEIENELR